ncbi:MAG TPA: nucleoside monophosphate kinase [Candidatus Paceibacterota bacterium]|nr:nucleoside monophosphate kinase [Candidatus Paceibacterota bacterium]
MSTVYLLYGKSGCGKGTQAQLLKERLESQGRSVIYVETGKLFRAFSESNPGFMGDHVKSVIDAGKLMPAFFPVYLWSRAIVEGYTGTQDIILDGVARRIEEASIVDSALDFLEINNRYVMHINVSDAWVFDHMGKRDRVDDTTEGMQKRLSWFTENVMPVINYFSENKKYTSVTINGEQTIEQVADDIEHELGK